MARIRTIKPEFFTSEDIVALSPMARLLYIAVWCEADKEGRLTWKPRTFKLRYFPGDNCDIEALAGELVRSSLVVLYGDGLAYVPGFAKHQHVNPREATSVLPAPPGVSDQGPRKIGKNVREFVMDRDGHACIRCGSTDSLQIDHILPQSCGGPHVAENLRVLCRPCNAARPVAGRALDLDLARDGLSVKILRDKFGIDASIPDLHAQGGREGKGKEGEEAEARIRPTTTTEPEPPDAPASVTPLAESAAASDAVVDRVLAEYPATLPDCQRVSVLTAKRRRLILAADKLARRFCRERGLDYGPAFWALYWAECAEDEWLAGRKPNPNNPAWKQSIDVLLREDTIARVLDAVVSRKEAA